ncbi:hypothetical protein BH23BAC3_BH23BAC3_02170 [soil metagenome]
MSTKTGLIIVACLIAFILIRVNIALTYQDKPQNSLNDRLDLPAAFTGTLPCEDCPDTEYELRLEEGQFTEFSRFVDRDPQHDSRTGTWHVSGDILTIHADNSDHLKRFQVSENSLKVLEKNGIEISEEIAEDYRLSRNTEFQSILNQHFELRKKGVKFVGNGNEPFWAFHVMKGDTLVFMKPELEVKSQSLEIKQRESGVDYLATFNSDIQIEIRAEKQFCRDTMSGFMFTHVVTITEDGDKNTGCGRYL